MTILGSGELVSGEEMTGTARHVDTIEHVLAMLDEPTLADVVLVTSSASATAIMPLLPEIGGVVCSSGGRTSHLATIARDFGLTCIMGATSLDPASLEGRLVRLTKDGQVLSA